MSTAKFLLYSGLGIAAVLLLTSDRANVIRKNLAEKTKDNAGVLKDKLKTFSGTARKRLADVKDLLGTEMEGLTDDARKRILNVVDGATNGAHKLKNNLTM